jgi:hypothetical protein
MISSLTVFLWALLGSLLPFITVLLGSGTAYLFSLFTSESCIKLFFKESGFHPFFFFPSLHLVLCKYVLDKLVGGFSCLFSFLGLVFVLQLSCLLGSCAFSVPGLKV